MTRRGNTSLATGVFSHGIASGDPSADAVILWTRITPDNPASGTLDVTWEVSQDENFTTLDGSGIFQTNAARDWTVKIDATDLSSDAVYYYRFRVGDTFSPLGQTKTLPSGSVEAARFAVVSCANWEHGFWGLLLRIWRRRL